MDYFKNKSIEEIVKVEENVSNPKVLDIIPLVGLVNYLIRTEISDEPASDDDLRKQIYCSLYLAAINVGYITLAGKGIEALTQ